MAYNTLKPKLFGRDVCQPRTSLDGRFFYDAVEANTKFRKVVVLLPKFNFFLGHLTFLLLWEWMTTQLES